MADVHARSGRFASGRRRGVAVVLVLLLAFLSSAWSVDAQEPEERAEQAREEAGAAEQRAEQLARERRQLQAQLDRAVRNFEGRRGQFERLDRAEQLAQDELGRLEDEATALEDAQEHYIRRLYKHPPAVLLEWVVRQDTIDDAIHSALTVPRVLRAGQARTEAVLERQEELVASTDEVDDLRADARRALDELVAAQQELEGLLVRAQQLERRAVADAAAARERAEELTAAAARAAAAGTSCPVGAPNSFVDTWGAPRSGGRHHEGVDIFAAQGTAVYAVATGVIERMDRLSLGGITLHLRSDAGDRFYYAHLDGYAPGTAPGDRVVAGELLAYVGRTGNARTTPPHLHWEVHPDGGAAVDPTPMARELCR